MSRSLVFGVTLLTCSICSISAGCLHEIDPVDHDIVTSETEAALSWVEAGKDPVGFGVAGTHTRDWAADGRAWTYNWGHDPAPSTVDGDAVYLPMVWGGPLCTQRGRLDVNRLDVVDRYRSHVCSDARCKIDARGVVTRVEGNKEVKEEIIFANGKRILFRDKVLISSKLMTDETRYCGAKDALGRCNEAARLCYGKKAAECRPDSYEVVRVGNELWESFSLGGRYINVEFSSGGSRASGLLADVARYCGPTRVNGICTTPGYPCSGKSAAECRFDTRAMAGTDESITAQGRYFLYTRPRCLRPNQTQPGTCSSSSTTQCTSDNQCPMPPPTTDRLENVERYRFSSCLARGSNQDCVLDSRAILPLADNQRLESISAAWPDGTGRYANWNANAIGPDCAESDLSRQAALAELDRKIAKHPGPGQRWFIFNEPDMRGQADLVPEKAATFYASVYRRIKQRDASAKVYCCGTVPAECNTADCGNWMKRFADALPSDVNVDAIHYHSYATGEDAPMFFSSGGTAVIEGMISFSNAMQAHERLRNRPIAVTEWGGLTNDMSRMCGPASPNNVDDTLLPVASWLKGEGRSRFRYIGAAWFVDYCVGRRTCSTGATLYRSNNGTEYDCGTGCQRTCLGDGFFGQVAGTWSTP